MREAAPREDLLREAVPGRLAGVREVDEAAAPRRRRASRAPARGRARRWAGLAGRRRPSAPSCPRPRGRASCRRSCAPPGAKTQDVRTIRTSAPLASARRSPPSFPRPYALTGATGSSSRQGRARAARRRRSRSRRGRGGRPTSRQSRASVADRDVVDGEVRRGRSRRGRRGCRRRRSRRSRRPGRSPRASGRGVGDVELVDPEASAPPAAHVARPVASIPPAPRISSVMPASRSRGARRSSSGTTP